MNLHSGKRAFVTAATLRLVAFQPIRRRMRIQDPAVCYDGALTNFNYNDPIRAQELSASHQSRVMK
jgi:hypothetical protein